MSRGVEL